MNLKLIKKELERFYNSKKAYFKDRVNKGALLDKDAQNLLKPNLAAIEVFKKLISGREIDSRKIDLLAVYRELKTELEKRQKHYPSVIEKNPLSGIELNKRLQLMQQAVNAVQDLRYTGSHRPVAANYIQAHLVNQSQSLSL